MRVGLAALVVIGIGLGGPVVNAAADLIYPANRPLEYSAMVPLSRPGYLSPVTDPAFGTQVVRISDQSAFGSTDQYLRNSYAKMQPWNADGSRVLLSYTKTGYVLDGHSYRLLNKVPLNTIGDAVWSNTDPDAIYRSEGNALVRVSASTGAVTSLHVFAGYTSVVVGGGEGSTSNDDRYVALLATSPAGSSALVYDLVSNTVVGSRVL